MAETLRPSDAKAACAVGPPSGRPLPLPTDNSEYACPAYWDKRFEVEAEREWFAGTYVRSRRLLHMCTRPLDGACSAHAALLDYEQFRHLVERHRGCADRVLVLGCGNSRLSEQLAELSGFACVVSTDVAPSVLQRMAQRTRATSALDWLCADMMMLPFARGAFDLVIEKGVFDCISAAAKSPWHPPPEVRLRRRWADVF